MNELARISRLAEIFREATPGALGARSVDLGIGDDAAVLDPDGKGRLVWTVDAQVEDVHFRRAWLSWEDVGFRSFVAAMSDVSAMGAAPWCALSAVTLPPGFPDAALEALATGQRRAADHAGAVLIGGNLSSAPVVTVTTTAIGRATRPIRRGGARPGDALWVAGELGMAAAGLRALAQGIAGAAVEPAVLAWRRPRSRVEAGLEMTLSASAAIDVSDGLARDAAHLAEASGVAVVLDRELLLAHAGQALADAALAVAADPWELLLGGGEDYALVATSQIPLAGFTHVGEVREGEGVIVRGPSGETLLRQLPGFDHFGAP